MRHIARLEYSYTPRVFNFAVEKGDIYHIHDVKQKEFHVLALIVTLPSKSYQFR